MFGIGDGELALIVLFAFLLFGPDKLPGMGRTIGRALRQFRTAQEGVTKVVQSEIIDPIQNVADTPAGKAAAEAAKEDEDLTEEEVAAAKPKETFAERRARLAAEKAEAAKGVTPAVDAAADADSDDDADAAQDVEPEPEEPAKDEPAPNSVEALYGLDDDDEDDDELDDEEDEASSEAFAAEASESADPTTPAKAEPVPAGSASDDDDSDREDA